MSCDSWRDSWIVVVLVVLAVLGTPASAQAGWKLDRAQAIAEHAWHYRYGCAAVSILWQQPGQAFDAATLAAWARDGEEPLMWTRPALAVPARCAVYVNVNRARRWGMSWPEVCTSMLHEYGHLAGRPHSTNPRSIMFATPRTNWRCRNRGRPYLERYDLFW